ncbi:LacI family DNA-binding transcriptional regulator [Asanoa siamensis]|uniref:LacI family transcriptional regulator n=1 Tax=Asanoa siamensis TaxID=926357 RepID=A0ABQ4CLH4_9ACTN|nr:LacI family DNA-binding transcriptional regulator [Asanoa siamensis]GIF72141.1 LacI family transcriptional regulator [Asanoa siamensis]
MPTIYEVAARAGVSPATVSRVFNGQNVSADKSRRVREAAETLGFTPNRVARTLRLQNSEVIALVIPDIENPFFTSLARGVEDVAQAAGYSVVLCNTDEDHEKESRYLDIALSANMAGVILAAAGDHSDLDALIRRGRPIVAVDRGPHGYDIDAVLVDSRAGGRAATEALAAQGFRRIACITGPRDVETATLRAEGWRAAVTGLRLEHDEQHLIYADFRIDGGHKAMRQLVELPTPPDAVFVANNLMGVGALQLLAERGLLPPAVGMAVFGDLPIFAPTPLAVTLVSLPARHLGVTAADLLLKRINGDDQPPRTIVLRNQIVASS